MSAVETARPARRSTPPRPAIRVEGVARRFGRTPALAGADLVVEHGQLVALVGPSGSGKTTLLRTIAGFETPDAGRVSIDGRHVAGRAVFEEPERRGVGMVFQDGALFPHLTVAGNVGFGDASPERVEACLRLVGLADRGGDYPHELSGGERQRVALARALAPEPAVVLLDEPFASLDPALRESLREEVVDILRRAGTTALLVTHDQEDALAVADRVAVMHDGRIEQAGVPEELYRRPATRWVAEFIGDADVLPGVATGDVVDCELGRLEPEQPVRGEVAVVLRPESLVMERANGDQTGGDGIEAEVLRRRFFGHDQLVWLELPSGLQVRSRRPDASAWQRGDRVRVRVRGPVHVLDGDAHARGG